jgi:hypothetical protein
MAHVTSIEKPLRESKNTSGPKVEREMSKIFHAQGFTLLVSSQLLRKRMMGQLDLARMVKDKSGWIIEIGEVKSSTIGEEMMIRGQRRRLFGAQKFLSGLFGYRSRLIPLTPPDPNN